MQVLNRLVSRRHLAVGLLSGKLSGSALVKKRLESLSFRVAPKEEHLSGTMWNSGLGA